MEAELNRLDAQAGDGDTGSTVATGARSVLAALPRAAARRPGRDLPAASARSCRASMGGSSGVLLSIFFTAAGQQLAEGAASPAALAEGLARIRFYGGAGPGDRTLIDALAPAIDGAAAAGSPRRPRRPGRRGGDGAA